SGLPALRAPDVRVEGIWRLFFIELVIRIAMIIILHTRRGPGAQQAHLEPHHHRVAVQPHRADRHARPTLTAILGKAYDLRRERAIQCLAVELLHGDWRVQRRTGHQTEIATDAGS